MNEKRKLGFRTYSSDLQDRFDEILSQLATKEAAWTQVRDWALSLKETTNQQVVESLDSPRVEETLLAIQVCMLDHANLMLLVAQLGEALTQALGQLAKVERRLEQLDHRIK